MIRRTFFDTVVRFEEKKRVTPMKAIPKLELIQPPLARANTIATEIKSVITPVRIVRDLFRPIKNKEKQTGSAMARYPA